MHPKIYRGTRTDGGCFVTVNGEPLQPLPWLPSFQWGHTGPAVEHLALAMAADCLGPEAPGNYRRLVVCFLAGVVGDWELSCCDLRRLLGARVQTPAASAFMDI